MNKPYTKDELVNTDVCPRHGQLVMAEYGNPDSGMVCEQCEAERETLRKEALHDEQRAEVDPEPAYETTDNEYYYSQEYINGGN